MSIKEELLKRADALLDKLLEHDLQYGQQTGAAQIVDDLIAALRSMPEPVAWREKAMELATDLAVESLRLGSYEARESLNGGHQWQVVMVREKREAAREKLRQHLFATPPTAPVPAEPQRLWLWKNFVDGRPEYWAFDNAYPINMDDGDPQTLGVPCGYALFKPSRAARTVPDEQVLQEIARATPHTEAVPLTDEEIAEIHKPYLKRGRAGHHAFARAVEQATAARLGVKMGDA